MSLYRGMGAENALLFGYATGAQLTRDIRTENRQVQQQCPLFGRLCVSCCLDAAWIRGRLMRSWPGAAHFRQDDGGNEYSLVPDSDPGSL